MGRGCDVGVGRSDLPHLSFLLGMLFTLLLCFLGACCDSAAPGGAISSKHLPGLRINGVVSEVDPQVVLEVLLLLPDFAFSLGELSMEELFGDAVV